MEGYQVSNQCQALVRDECLVPTKDAPELAFARQSTAEKYIPDVYYKVSEIWLVQFLVFFFFYGKNTIKKKRVDSDRYVYFSIQVSL